MIKDENYIRVKKEGMWFEQLVYSGKERIVIVPPELEDDEGCFRENTDIEEIIYSSGNRVVRDFRRCSNLRRIRFSETIAEFNYIYFDSLFDGCEKLTEIEVDPGNPFFTAENGMILNKEKDTLIRCAPGIEGTVSVPSTVRKIGENAFSDCRKIERVILPEELEEIGGRAFDMCLALRDIDLPEKISIIPDSCFSYCQSLKTVDLSHVDKIGKYAFNGCREIHLNIPGSVGSIGYFAFAGCAPENFVFEKAVMFMEEPFGFNYDAPDKVRAYPNLPLAVYQNPKLKLIAVSAFCADPDKYEGFIREEYEKYAKAQKKRILKDAQDKGLEKVLSYYGESVPQKEGTDDAGVGSSLSMTAAEARKLFKYSLRKNGISINEFKSVIAIWKSQGNYDSYFEEGADKRIILPDFIGGEPVDHIAHTMLPDEAVVICSNLVFQKLKRPVKASTAAAYLDDPTGFPGPEAEEILKFIKKYPAEVADRLAETGNVKSVTAFINSVRITPQIRSAMLEKAAGDPELTAVILDQQQTGEEGKGKTGKKKEDRQNLLTDDLAAEEKPIPVSELKKQWTYSLYSTEDSDEKLVDVRHYKGNESIVRVPARFGKNRLGRLYGRLLEGHEDVSELILPGGDYNIRIKLDGCDKLADPQGNIILHAGERVILTDYIGPKDVDSVVIPDDVTEIHYDAFDNVGMREIVIPGGCKVIESNAFYGCEKVQRVVFMNGATAATMGMLSVKDMLTDIYVPETVTEMWAAIKGLKIHGIPGSYAEAYAEKEQLEFVEWDDKKDREPLNDFLIRDGVLIKYTGNEEDVVIPETVNEIGDRAFYQVRTVRNVTVCEGVTCIGEYAFSSCGIRTIKLPSTLKKIGDCAFEFSPLSEISIPDGVEEIGGSAFAYTDLNEITIPAGVKKIGEDAFLTDGRDLVINTLSEIEL